MSGSPGSLVLITSGGCRERDRGTTQWRRPSRSAVTSANRHLQAVVLTELAAVQRTVGDYPAAAASSQQAVELRRDLRDGHSEAYALNERRVQEALLRLSQDNLAPASKR